MRHHSLLLASLLALGLGASNAVNAQCVGFADTADDVFCPAVEWLKNRSITGGCGATAFCPDSAVTRLSMAQFMNRLGKVTTPVVLHKELYITTNLAIGSPAGGVLLCQTDEDFAVTGYARIARFSANVYGVPVSQYAWLIGWWKYSIDAGVNWDNVPNTTSQRDWAGPGQVVGFSVMAPPMELEVGTTYRFALFGSGMGGPYTFNPFGCQIEVVIANHNRTASPLDE